MGFSGMPWNPSGFLVVENESTISEKGETDAQ